MAEKDSAQIRYLRRMPKEQYGHEEFEVTVTVAADDVKVAMDDLKNMVHRAILMAPVIKASEEKPEEESSEEVTDNESINDSVEAVVDVEGLESKPKRRGRPKKSTPAVLSEEGKIKIEEFVASPTSEVDDDPFEDDEEEATPPPKKFKTKATPYDNDKLHKNILAKEMNSMYPDWKKSKDKMRVMGEKLVGADFLDENGKPIQSFFDLVRKFWSKKP